MQVSVIIPTYNYGRFLREAIESVQQQTVDDFEIIVIDDGSTDETPEVLASISDPRLRVRRIPNSGASVARNTGIAMARGEYLALLDADDRWHATKLERQLQMMQSEPSLGLVFTDLVRFDDSGKLLNQFSFIPDLASVPSRPSRDGGGRVITADTFASLVLLSQFPAWPSTVMLRADRVRGIEFPPGVRICEDLHYMLRVYPRVQAGYIAEPLAELRRHGSNSYSSPAEMLAPVLDVLHNFSREPISAEHRQVLRRRLAGEWCAVGYHHFWNRKPLQAARAYLRALAYPGFRWSAVTHLTALPIVPFLPARQADA